MRLRGDSARCTSMKHPLWERLPNELRSRVDELIADDRQLPAIVAIRDTLDQPRPGIYECMDLLAERYAELVDSGTRLVQRVADRESTRLNSSHANISYAVVHL